MEKFLPDKTIDELNPEEIDLFIIPGGNPKYLYNDSKLKYFISELNNNNKFIAGICGGTYLMALCGLLKNKRCTGDSSGLKANGEYIDLFSGAVIMDRDVVVDGNIITSTGQAFIEFTFKLCKIMDVYTNENEAISVYKWFKNIK